MRTFYCASECKLSTFLLEKYNGQLSYSTFFKLLRKKDIKVDGKRVNSDVALSGNEKIEVYYDGKALPELYSVVFEDDNILVVDKFKNITSEDLFEQLKLKSEPLYFCHRLDRNTDGIMVFAKNECAYEELLDGFKARTFDKIYFARVYGIFEKKQDILTAYLKKDAKNATVSIYKDKRDDSKLIRTQYKVIEEHDGCSTLLIRLLTGRTHQIRAHLSYIGHFVLGDGKYGNEKINNAFKIKQLSLSSVKIALNFSPGKSLYYLNDRYFIKHGYESIIENNKF